MMSLPDTPCLLNGQMLPLNQAKVSVLDRGFIFGDGVYEVVPVYGRRLFRFEEHMARLARSLDKVRIPNPYPRDGWLRQVRTLVAAVPTGPVVHDALGSLAFVPRGSTPEELGAFLREQIAGWKRAVADAGIKVE